MLTNDRKRRICEKYRKRDKDGYVHCCECPLKKGDANRWDFRCKANCHYDRRTKEWEYDERSETDADCDCTSSPHKAV